MFRTGLANAKKILITRYLPLTFPSEVCVSGYTAVYDVRRSVQEKDFHRPILLPVDQLLLPSRHLMMPGSQSLIQCRHSALQVKRALLHPGGGCAIEGRQNLRFASSSFQMPNPAELACNLINMARCVDLNDLKDAPPPSFWVTLAVAGSQVGIPFLELIGGYSPVMTYLQLYLAAASLAWNGGMKWGLAISSNAKPPTSWDTMNMSLMPAGIAILGLLLPYPLGFLTIASGLVASLYCDLKSCIYPPWAIAAKFLVTLSSAIGLLLALMAYVLFHNRENAKKKKSVKEAPAAAQAEDAEEGGEEGEEVEGSEEKEKK